MMSSHEGGFLKYPALIFMSAGSLSLALSTEASRLLLLRCHLELLSLGLLAAGLLLLLQGLLLQLPLLHLVEGLHEHTLVLVSVTLGLAVEEVVHVLVDLLLLPVLAEETTQHA